MKQRHCIFNNLLFVICIIFLNSCFTGVVYHYPRVKTEINRPRPDKIKVAILGDKADTSNITQSVISEINHVQKKTLLSEAVYPKPTYKIKIRKPLWTDRVKKSKNLPGISEVNKKNESVLGVVGLFIALIVALIGLILVIVGYALGRAGFLIPFWILWVIGLLAILFSTVLSVFVRAFGFDKLFGSVSIIVYSLLTILAIALLLIVLL